jgi:shikimate 5-dehydrogenase
MALSISSVSSVQANLRILGRSGSPIGTEGMTNMEAMEGANTNVLVVGGSSGMGLALAKRGRDTGASVIIVGRTEDKLQRAREELQKTGGVGHGRGRYHAGGPGDGSLQARRPARPYRQHRGQYRRRL